MKISPISNFNYVQKLNKNNNITNSIKNNQYNLSFKSSYNDYYDVYYVDVPLKSFDPLNADQNELKKLGEVFHKYSDVETLCKRRYGTSLFTKYENTRAYKAYQKLSKSINETREHKKELVAEMNKLVNKEITGEGNMMEKKLEVRDRFLDFLQIEQNTDRKIPIENGILIYGNSRKKDDFINWLKNTSETAFKEIEYDENKPFDSIKAIKQALKNAQTGYEYTDRRSILYIKNLDKLLTNESDENVIMIAHFKSFAELASSKYHTTLLFKTDLPLENFEPASIATGRFGLKVELTNELSEKDEQKAKDLKQEITRLDKVSDKTNEYIKTEEITTYWNSENHLP
mgnify:CR=1 FL=1